MRADECEQARVDAAFAVPYEAVPPQTNRGVQHTVVHVYGFLPSNGGDGLVDTRLVEGRTKCGHDRLLLQRNVGGFPLCRRCHPDSGPGGLMAMEDSNMATNPIDTARDRCGSRAWTPHDDPTCPPNPPAPRCGRESGHGGLHEGRSIPHGKRLRWDRTDGHVSAA